MPKTKHQITYEYNVEDMQYYSEHLSDLLECNKSKMLSELAPYIDTRATISISHEIITPKSKLVKSTILPFSEFNNLTYPEYLQYVQDTLSLPPVYGNTIKEFFGYPTSDTFSNLSPRSTVRVYMKVYDT